jgi:cytidylate kinase
MLLLITGAPGSGKSTLAASIAKTFKAIIIPQDSFYSIPFNKFPYESIDKSNIEGNDIIDWVKLCTAVVKISTLCDFNIIVEGHRVFSCDILVELADVLIYLNEHKHIVKQRFMGRGAWSLTTDQIEMKGVYFDVKTWPAHLVYTDTYIKPVGVTDRGKYIGVDANIDNVISRVFETMG